MGRTDLCGTSEGASAQVEGWDDGGMRSEVVRLKTNSSKTNSSRELTYPPKIGIFESMIFRTSPGGICSFPGVITTFSPQKMEVWKMIVSLKGSIFRFHGLLVGFEANLTPI